MNLGCRSLSIPAEPGAYLLWLYLIEPAEIHVGRLGRGWFEAGDYLYCGSALGPGGIRARLSRHLAGNGRPHWHVDALRPLAVVRGVAWAVQVAGGAGDPRLECLWSQALAGLDGARIPLPGFGASDCREGCPAHLVRIASTALPGALAAVKTVARLAGVNLVTNQRWLTPEKP